MRWMRLEVCVDTTADREQAVARLRRAFDRPLSGRDPFGTVGPWTVFGAIEGDDVKAETAGEFHGQRAMNGYGFWQPVFRGELRPTATGSVLQGGIRFRLVVWVVVAFLVVLALSLVPLVPSALTDIAEGDAGKAVPKLALVVGIVVVPALMTLRVVRRGWREAHALRLWLENAINAPK